MLTYSSPESEENKLCSSPSRCLPCFVDIHTTSCHTLEKACSNQQLCSLSLSLFLLCNRKKNSARSSPVLCDFGIVMFTFSILILVCELFELRFQLASESFLGIVSSYLACLGFNFQPFNHPKEITPITRMALGYGIWITVLCRKLRDWWHWVADGDLPIVASHGTEVDVYNSLDLGVRVVILKALCDIRVEQEDI